MKDFVHGIADQFYTRIISSEFFSSFFVGKDFAKIKISVNDFLCEQLTAPKELIDNEKSYRMGVMHAKTGIPLNNVLDFVDYIQNEIIKYCEENPDSCINLRVSNLDHTKNSFAKGYLHETIKSTDMMSVPLFSVLSTTKIATSVISWMMDIQMVLLGEKVDKESIIRSNSCDLLNYLNKPFFNMIFESENDFHEFNRMHFELHNTANSLVYFLEDKNYVQSHYVYNDFVEQCKSFLNFYFERVVLFEQNNENYFYEFARRKAFNNRELTFCTFNIRNMQMINKVWGNENGDYIVNEVERIIDKEHGMNSDNSVFIKTQNAEFIVMLIDTEEETAKDQFGRMVKMVTTSIPERGEFHSDMKVSSAFLPFSKNTVDYINHIKPFITQAIAMANANENIPLFCNSEVMTNINTQVMNEMTIRHFIKQSFNSDNFRPFYHTIVSSENGRPVYVEALARVCDGDSCISAGSFIDYLVQTERIIQLDKVMLEKICTDLSILKNTAEKVFINVSPKSMRSRNFIEALNKFIIEAQNHNTEIVFEITEQSLFENIDIVRNLHDRYDATFAIDDFGAGYSNFSLVSELTQNGLIKYLKIDGTLIKGITQNDFKKNILKGITDIAKNLNLLTVAEFVSDAKTAEKLKTFGLDFMQGYHFSVPVPLTELKIIDK